MDDRAKRLIAAATLLLGGCAALPPCEKFQAQMMLDEGGNPHVVIDLKNAEKLRALIVGVSERTCRLPE